jgi:hypothetical protein
MTLVVTCNGTRNVLGGGASVSDTALTNNAINDNANSGRQQRMAGAVQG